MMRRLLRGPAVVLLGALIFAANARAQAPGAPVVTGTTNIVASPAGPNAPSLADVERRAAKGDVSAEMTLSVFYFRGVGGLPRDMDKSYQWALKAAEAGNPRAAQIVAGFYSHGVVVPQDDAQALLWTTRAAEGGDPASQTELGARYESGRGVPADLARAADWYRKAALLGDQEGQGRYGAALLTGRGVPKDEKTGFTYLLSSARRNVHANAVIAQCYASGIFVARDLAKAYGWCQMALPSDPDAAALAETLEPQLTAAQIAGAKQWAAARTQQLQQGDIQSADFAATFGSVPAVMVPFELVLGKIIIPVQLADGQTHYFLIDTGSDLTLIDDRLAGPLKLAASEDVAIGGTGANLELERLAGGLDLQFPGLHLSGVNAVLMSGFNLDQEVGHPLSGILGCDVLRRLVVSIDYVHRTLLFQPAGGFHDDGSYHSETMGMMSSRPMVGASLDSPAGPCGGTFLLDTGDDDSVTLAKPFQDAYPALRIEGAAGTESIGVGGLSHERAGVGPALTLDNVVIPRPNVVLLADREGIWAHLLGGVLGVGILGKFDLTFDGPNQRLYFRKNAQFDDPVPPPGIGAGIRTDSATYHQFTVFAVAPGSPAGRAGLQVGDIITAIEGTEAARLSLDDLLTALKKPGAHALSVQRAGAVKILKLER
ncbi:MAG: PDZ domain-containing protein, partial [Verrucomicrobiota bacterium]